jgi:hypothetical protein
VGQRKATRAVATLVAVAALVAGGCRTDREITRPDPVPVTEERLTEALLTDIDVPSPYVLAEDAEPLPAELVPEHECDDRLADLEAQRAVSATFTGPDATFTNTIAWFRNNGDAVGAAYTALLTDCRQAVVADSNLSFTTRTLDFGVLSDDTLPIVIAIQPETGPIEERVVIVMRTGDLVSTIRYEGPRPTDLVVLDAVVRVAIGKLGLLDQDT